MADLKEFGIWIAKDDFGSRKSVFQTFLYE